MSLQVLPSLQPEIHFSLDENLLNFLMVTWLCRSVQLLPLFTSKSGDNAQSVPSLISTQVLLSKRICLTSISNMRSGETTAGDKDIICH